MVDGAQERRTTKRHKEPRVWQSVRSRRKRFLCSAIRKWHSALVGQALMFGSAVHRRPSPDPNSVIRFLHMDVKWRFEDEVTLCNSDHAMRIVITFLDAKVSGGSYSCTRCAWLLAGDGVRRSLGRIHFRNAMRELYLSYNDVNYQWPCFPPCEQRHQYERIKIKMAKLKGTRLGAFRAYFFGYFICLVRLISWSIVL